MSSSVKEAFTQDELDASDDDDAEEMDTTTGGDESAEGLPDHWDQDAPVNGACRLFYTSNDIHASDRSCPCSPWRYLPVEKLA